MDKEQNRRVQDHGNHGNFKYTMSRITVITFRTTMHSEIRGPNVFFALAVKAASSFDENLPSINDTYLFLSTDKYNYIYV